MEYNELLGSSWMIWILKDRTEGVGNCLSVAYALIQGEMALMMMNILMIVMYIFLVN